MSFKDLFGSIDTAEAEYPEWRPHALSKEQWPPDYNAVWMWRVNTLRMLSKDPEKEAAALKYYSTRPLEWIMDWCDTYDPRRENNKWMPFVFFLKQVDLVQWLQDLIANQESGLAEKSRDMGATWVACAFSVWAFLFVPGFSIGWGSRKEGLVDTIGDADSIFEKLRLILKRVPGFFRPKGFSWARDSKYMSLKNPSNGASITGEAGDNIGRGGRKSMYIKDEAAHYERPEKIEAALGDNTNVQIDISSVNGLGNVFHRRREHGVIWQPGAPLQKGFVSVFVMDWRDHPLKTQEWYDARRAKYEREGMLHVFAQEVDRDYSAAIANTVIPYEWIKAAVDAHIHIPYVAEAYEMHKGRFMMGLDVADEGLDKNALAIREWIIWRITEEWGSRDVGVTARHAIMSATPYKGRITCMYDCIGVGAGVKTEYNRLVQDEGLIDQRELPFVPWNAGAAVLNPYDRIIPDDADSLKNHEFFHNLKAQGWWSLRTRFYKTWKVRTEGVHYPADELISLDSRMPLLDQVCKELAQPTRGESTTLKMLINKKPIGTKSPNLADAGVQMFFPVRDEGSQIIVGNYGH